MFLLLIEQDIIIPPGKSLLIQVISNSKINVAVSFGWWEERVSKYNQDNHAY